MSDTYRTPVNQGPVARLLARLRAAREASGLVPEDVDRKLILGPGWTRRFEAGEVVPAIDMLLALARAVGLPPGALFEDAVGETSPPRVDRAIWADEGIGGLRVHFRYASHDAVYELPGGRLSEFEDVVRRLRDGLALLASTRPDEEQATKNDAVVSAFLLATQTWPSANPSDLWWFVISRAYCDPYNHPAAFARLDLGQSWKRTAGWALEEVLARHYSPFLRQFGIYVEVAKGARKQAMLRQLTVVGRLEAAKIDVLLVGERGGKEVCFGAVHVKASFAERRTDDVPLSQALLAGGYTSVLWTLDCKSTPSEHPLNKGELGELLGNGPDRRSAKRKDIEEDGLFSACFSYNSNTLPTPAKQAAKARVFVCGFGSPDDDFSRFIRAEWEHFSRRG